MKKTIISLIFCFAMLSGTTASACIFFNPFACFCYVPKPCIPKPKPCTPKPKPCTPKPKPCTPKPNPSTP